MYRGASPAWVADAIRSLRASASRFPARRQRPPASPPEPGGSIPVPYTGGPARQAVTDPDPPSTGVPYHDARLRPR